MRRDERLTARTLGTLFSMGWNASRVAQHYGVNRRTVILAAARQGMGRFDAPGVLSLEIAARHGVTSEAVVALAQSRGIPGRIWRGVWLYSPHSAALLDAHYAQQHAPEDYAHYLTSAAASARLGITPAGLHAALKSRQPWAAPLIRVQVRTCTRWAYRYCPYSVEAARAKRGA